MASSINWLDYLPHLDVAEVEVVDARIRTQTDAGPALVRRQYTAAPEFIRGRFNAMAADRAAAFDAFWREVTKGGSLSFNYEHPIRDVMKEMRFVSRSPLVMVRRGHHTQRLWSVSVVLEVLPDAS